MLKSRNMGFIMPAKKTSPVEKICKEFKKGESPAETDYTVSSAKEEEEVWLLLAGKETENGIEIHPFITNLDTGPDEASENYRWRRWIETNIRELEKFRPVTTSQSMELRRLYFLIAMILYNLWILTRGIGEFPRAYQFKRSLKFELKVLEILDKETRPPPIQVLA